LQADQGNELRNPRQRFALVSAASVITEKLKMNLSPLAQRFVLHFGEMGSRWGINRTVGQIYALLYVSEQPLNADDIVDKLMISRSNVSMGLKDLETWRLVKLSHLPGDRRAFFSAPDDIWLIFKTLAEERQRREIDPTLTLLREALLDKPEQPGDEHAQARIRQMYELTELLTNWFADIRKLSPATLQSLMKMGGAVVRLLELKDRMVGAGGPSQQTADNRPGQN